MIHRGIELLDVNFKAEQGFSLILAYRLPDIPRASFNTSLLYTRVSIMREYPGPYGLEDIHDRMMNYPVGIVWQTVNDALLWLVYREYVVRRCPECLILQRLMELQDIGFTVPVMDTHAVRPCLTLTRFLIRQLQVFYRYYLFVQIPYPLHICFAFLVRGLRAVAYQPFF